MSIPSSGSSTAHPCATKRIKEERKREERNGWRKGRLGRRKKKGGEEERTAY